MHNPITLREFAEAQRLYDLAASSPGSPSYQLVSAVRDSFHSLIGDIWVSALTRGVFSSRSLNMSLAGPLFLWDSEIPTPTKQTALAWLLTLENPIELINGTPRKYDEVIALPESIDPANMWVQTTGPWSSITSSHMLDHLRNIHQYLPQDFRKRLAESRQEPMPLLYFGTRGTLDMHYRIAVDNRHDLTPDKFRRLCVKRMFLLSEVLTPPGMPLTLDSMEYRGLNLLPWLKSGLVVAPPKEPVMWGNGVKFVSSLADPIMTQVPCATPPLWLGFSIGGLARAMFVERYFSFRRHAIEQLLQLTFSSGVKQDRWLKELSAKGMLDEPVPDDSKRSKLANLAKGIQLKGFDDLNI